MRLIFAGTPAVALPSLQALMASHHEVVAVVTRPDAPAGRGRRQAASPIKEAALTYGLPIFQPRLTTEPAFINDIRDLAPDCCPVVAYGALVPRTLLNVPRLGWVNLHFSLLPAWRGAAPVNHAIMAGDDITGATTFLLDEGLDTGPVLGTMTEPIQPRDTAGDLLDRMAHAGAGLLVATMDELESGQARPAPQLPSGASIAPKLTSLDARVVWAAPALAVDRQIRGCTPAPGAWTMWRGERLKIGPIVDVAADLPAELVLDPGEVCVLPDRVVVGTGSLPVVLDHVQPAGKRRMPVQDWARGVRPRETECFDADGDAA